MSSASKQGDGSSSPDPDSTTSQMPVIQRPLACLIVWIGVIVAVIVAAIFSGIMLKQQNDELERKREDAAIASAASCHPGWHENQGRCYFISETECTWNDSLQNCFSYNASLVKIDTESELDFLINNSTCIYYWINPEKKIVELLWNQSNGSLFLGNFQNEDEDLCPYMNNKRLSKTWCTNKQKFICSKPLRAP